MKSYCFLRGEVTAHHLLPDLFHLRGSLRSGCRLDKVLGDNLVLSQPPEAALHHPQDLL